MSVKLTFSARLLATSSLLFVPSLAFAQAEPARVESDSAQIEEIVVTAQKRRESLQDTPVAVSAVTAQTIEDRGITDVGSLSSIAPNLVVNQTPASSTSPAVFIRGIGEAEPILTADAPNALYIDGVPIGRSTGAMFDLVDLERIEVLRGPQGTLYGRNTTGGAINLITRKPARKFGVSQLLSYGRFDLFQSRTTLDTGELGTSGLAATFSYVHKQRDGYVDNILAPASKDPGAFNVDAFRAALSYDNGGAVRADYAFDYNHRDSRGIPVQLAAAFPYVQGYLEASPFLGGAAPQISRNRLKQLRLDHDGKLIDKVSGHTLTIEADLGEDATLRSITGYRRWTSLVEDTDLDGNGDLVGFTVDFEGNPEGINPISLYNGDTQSRQQQWSQELNLIGKIGDKFDYVLGAFLFEETARQRDFAELTFVIPVEDPIDLGPVTIPAVGLNFDTLLQYRHRSRSQAVFGQSTWQVSNRFSVTGGLRYTWDQKKLDVTDPAVVSGEARFHQLTWMANAKYDFSDDVSAYGRVATGYKSGGFNARSASQSFDPEKVISYELGLKSELFDRRVRLNLAAFHTRYRDLQVSQFEAGSSGANSVTVNAGRATYTGVEAELLARVTPNLTLSGNIGYVDRKYKTYLFRDPDTDELVNIASTARFSYSASTTANAGVEYAFPTFGIGRLSARLDYNYRSRVYFHPVDALAPFNSQIADCPASTLDGRLTLSELKIGGAEASIALWGKNITNTEYLLSGIDFGPLGFANVTFAEPRSWGIDLRVRF
jgi:iron complex outermembrane receptor protein